MMCVLVSHAGDRVDLTRLRRRSWAVVGSADGIQGLARVAVEFVVNRCGDCPER